MAHGKPAAGGRWGAIAGCFLCSRRLLGGDVCWVLWDADGIYAGDCPGVIGAAAYYNIVTEMYMYKTPAGWMINPT